MAVLFGSIFSDSIVGTFGNDEIYAFEGNDVIFGGFGNDFTNGGFGFDVMDYSFLGEPVTLLPSGFIDKNGLGTDQLFSVEGIIGAVGEFNVIDGSSGNGITSFSIDLSQNSLTVNDIPGLGDFSFYVENFVDVIGTPNADTIIGDDAGNIISGQGGDDVLLGGDGNDLVIGGSGADFISGTNVASGGFGEVDTLIGGSGGDVFALGDDIGGYYIADGNNDFAEITDFSVNDLILLGAGEFYSILSDASGFDLFAVTSGVLELVADVQTTSSFAVPAGVFQLASGQTVGNFVGA
ncbi:MAG: hypothetical protein WBA57_13715 [Elainellaceae cyanobacterium]